MYKNGEHWKRQSSIKLILVTVAFLLSTNFLSAQQVTIKGKISAAGGDGLPSASVKLLSPRDSSVLASVASDINGVFSLSDSIRKTHYILQATFIGFNVAFKGIAVTAGVDTLHVGTIELRERAIRLETVTVTEKRDPIVIKKDTIEYRAEAFPTLRHARVESLLRKIPGIDVNRDGTITSGGEEVTRIFINGKEVFGNNLQLITKNLPADAIDKIQVVDDKSDAQRFSSSQSISTAKAINLEIKESHKKMIFGNVMGGISDDRHYAGSGNLNLFNEGDQVTAIGKSNNINNQEITTQDGNINGSEPEPGVITSHSGSVNFLKSLTKTFSLSGSYHSILSDNKTETYLTRQLFQPEGMATYSETNYQKMETLVQQATAGVQLQTTSNTLKVTASGNLSDVKSSGTINRESQSANQSDGYSGERIYGLDNLNLNGTLIAFYGHKFRKKGRSITLNGQYSLFDNTLGNKNSNVTTFGDTITNEKAQLNDQHRTNDNYSITFSYTEPIGKKQQLSAEYSLLNRSARSTEQIFDLIEGAELFNGELSNEINSGFVYQQAGLSYQLNEKKYTLTLASVVQQAELSRKSFEEIEMSKQMFETILPYGILSIKISDYSKLNLQYNTAVREPSLNELQPMESQNDPVNLFLPNPTLRPEYVHQGRINFNTSSRKNRSVYFSISANGSYVKRPITRAITIDENQVVSTQYFNTDHSKNASANIQTSIPIRKLKSNFKVATFATYHTATSLLNGVVTPQTQYSYGINAGYSFTYKKTFDFNATGFYATNLSEISASMAAPQSFTQSQLFADATLHIFRRLSLAAAFSYRALKNEAVNFDEEFPILNFSIGLMLFKNSNGQINFSGNNVLNQDATATQASTASYIEQRVNRAILGRYFMLSFTYHFSKRQDE